MKTFHEFLQDRPQLEAFDLKDPFQRKLVILRSRLIPEVGIMIDTQKERGTLFYSVFLTPEGKRESQHFLVVCACCQPESEEFRREVQSVCRKQGIKTLLLRRGTSWDEKVGKLHGTEVRGFYDFFIWLRSLKILKDAFAGIGFGH